MTCLRKVAPLSPGLGRIPISSLCALVLLVSPTSAAPASAAGNRIVKVPVIDKQDIRFISITNAGRLFQAGVSSVAQDNRGFLWLGTDDGLYRFDGYSLKPYRHENGDPNSLSDDRIRVVRKDRAGALWVGTVSGGLDRLDTDREIFTHYRHDPGNIRSLGSDGVAEVYQDRNGVLWICTNGGLDRLEPGSATFVHYKPDPRDAGTSGSDDVTSVAEDRMGNLWVGTLRGLKKLDPANGRLSRLADTPATGLLDGYVTSIRNDRSGGLWASIGSRLIAIDVNANKITDYPYHPDDRTSQSDDRVLSIYEDRDRVLWVGTLNEGLLKLDRERSKFIRYARDPGNPDSLPNKLVSTLFEDAEGEMWVGTGSGLNRFPRVPLPFVNYKHEAGNPNSLRDNLVGAVQEDSEGFLWIAGAGRLNRLDRKTGKLTVYQHDRKDPHSLSNQSVPAMVEDHSGTLWFGTLGGGLNRFDRVKEQFFAYRHQPGSPHSLSTDNVLCLLADRQGALWVGTLGGGLNRFDASTRRFTSYRNDPTNAHSLSNDIVKTMFEDRAGMLWLGTDNGLNQFHVNTQQFSVYRHNAADPQSLSQNSVTSILEDRQGTLWIGTPNGLDQMDRTHGTFKTFTNSDGLPDSAIEAILEDDEGHLWLATHNGISRFDPRAGTFRNYSESDGLASNRVSPNDCRTRSGEMIFGTRNGLTTFYPNRISNNPYVPPVVLTDFLLFNTPVRQGRNSPLGTAIHATRSLTLNHSQNIFTLQFAALSYQAPENNRYRYRLEGLETQWNEVDSDRRQATYTSLPPGNYVFRVQGSNNDQTWNEQGATLAITILPPWWRTWTFMGLVLLSAIGLAVGAYRNRVRSWERAARRLEIQVSERTRELQIANVAAEAARAGAESANRAKSVFLANMSHELRTPLNAILGFSNLLRQEAVSEKQRRDLDIINRSGEHLLTLINDVLDVAKIEAGRQELKIEPCNLHLLVKDATDMMRVRAAEKNLALICVESPDFPNYVWADAAKLREVLLNLLSNAIKYTEEGSVTLRSNTRTAAESEHVLLVFEIEDTGIGIAAGDQARIFESFVRVHKPTTQKGTGLGLTITRQFVELMGGTINVESTPGKGSLFRVEVPVEPARESEVKVTAAKRERVLGLQPGEPEYRILIVENEKENWMVLERLLQNAGFQVRVAEDGAQGIEMFRIWRPHFIWMDLRMPGMSGVEAARRIRALDGGMGVKIAALTASVFADQKSEVLAEGLDDFVRKPYRPGEIFDCMARHLGVRYHYEAASAARTDSSAAPRSETLAMLPEHLRRELRETVITLDVNRIAAVIGRVSDLDPVLGAALARCSDRFAYTAILEAIDACNVNLPEEIV